MTETQQFANAVVKSLREAGYDALWAGGCVRDLLMGNSPSDYDVATSATPQQVRELFGFRRTLPVGMAFGVVIVLGPNRSNQQVEVATFRSDASYSDGRRPDAVTFTTPEEDASRRDFTINGMFYDPLEQHVIDYVGGQQDLHARIIRAIGDPHARLSEDKLRMLRAVRFAARFGFEIESETLRAVKLHASEVAVVSAERIAVEVRKTLQTQQSSWAVKTWFESGLLRVIAPELMDAWPQIGEPALRLVEAISTEDWLTKAAALHWPLVAIDKASPTSLIEAWKLRLKLANEEADALRFALAAQPVLERAGELEWSQVQPWLIKPHIATAKNLLAARSQYEIPLRPMVTWVEDKLQIAPDLLDPPPLIDGQDLQRLGMKPGPQFRTILQTARNMQLDGELKGRDDALNWLASCE